MAGAPVGSGGGLGKGARLIGGGGAQISSQESERQGLCVWGGVEMEGRMGRHTPPGKPDFVVFL